MMLKRKYFTGRAQNYSKLFAKLKTERTSKTRSKIENEGTKRSIVFYISMNTKSAIQSLSALVMMTSSY